MRKNMRMRAAVLAVICTFSFYGGLSVQNSYAADSSAMISTASEIVDEGDYDDFHWVVTSDNQLIISPRTAGQTAVISDFYTELENPDPLAQEHYMEIEEPTPWWPYSTITSVIIEDGITAVGAYAFYCMRGLTSVYMADSVKRIGKKAFYETSVENIHWSQNLTYIEESAFQGANFSELTLPDHAGIGKAAFKNCKSLSVVTLRTGMNALNDEVFYGCENLTEIVLPDTLTEIGSYAFRDCTGLTEITIPDSVTTLARGSFYGCSGLTSVQLGDGLTEIPWDCFGYCSSLKSVVIDNNITTIGSAAFSDCTSLGYVYLGDKVNTLKGAAFSNCKSLNRLVILNPVLEMPLDKIGSSDTTDYIIYGISGSTAQAYAEEHGIRFEVYGDIGDNIYQFADNLTWTIKDGTLIISGEGEIPDYTFTGDSLTKNSPWSIFASEITAIIVEEGITRIGNKAFMNMKNAVSVVLPSTLKSIGDSAFQRCGVQELAIPEGVTEIGDNAFQYCGFQELTIPEGVTAIGTQALRNCDALVTLTLPGTLDTVPKNLCGYCTSLKTVNIAEGTKVIDDSAFIYCTALKNVTFPETLETINGAAFCGTAITEVSLGNHFKSIGASAFCDCKALTTLNLGNSITEIGTGAFENSGVAGDITIPATVSSIGACAFLDCPKIKSVKVLAPELRLINAPFGYVSDEKGLHTAIPTTIYGYEGSKAQAYANKENAFTFIALEWDFPMGDVNLDGNFSITDVVMVQKWLLGTSSLPYWKNADYMADNEIDVFDLCLMKRALISSMTTTD